MLPIVHYSNKPLTNTSTFSSHLHDWCNAHSKHAWSEWAICLQLSRESLIQKRLPALHSQCSVIIMLALKLKLADYSLKNRRHRSLTKEFSFLLLNYYDNLGGESCVQIATHLALHLLGPQVIDQDKWFCRYSDATQMARNTEALV